MTKIKVLGVTVAMLALAVAGAAPALAEDFVSQTIDQYNSEYCTWEVAGPIVQGAPPNWECVSPGTAVPL